MLSAGRHALGGCVNCAYVPTRSSVAMLVCGRYEVSDPGRGCSSTRFYAGKPVMRTPLPFTL